MIVTCCGRYQLARQELESRGALSVGRRWQLGTKKFGVTWGDIKRGSSRLRVFVSIGLGKRSVGFLHSNAKGLDW